MARGDAVIERPRLARRIYDAMKADVTLITAPPGFGKTTVLNEVYLDVAGKRVRLDLNALDDTLFRFVLALSRAIDHVAPGTAVAFPAAYERALGSPLGERLLARWMVEQLEGTWATVFIDQLHYISETERVAEFLALLVDESRKRVKWVLATREDFGLPIDVWHATKVMRKPVGAEDLRFEFHEVAVAAAIRRADKSHRELKEIFSGTAGWPMGVLFALRGGEQFAGPECYDRLLQRVFVDRSEREREFLLSTSMLPYMDDAICAAAGWSDAAQIIEEMREDAPFIFINGQTRRQYHEAFAAFLRGILRQRGPVDVSAVLKIAAGALEEMGDITGALLMYTRFPVAEETARLKARLPKR